MSLAADARAAVDERPFLREALRAGVVNYSAAARAIDVGDDVEAVATALRRYADRLATRTVEPRGVNVTMHSGLTPSDDEPGLLAVNGRGYVADGGELTGVLATGEVDPVALGHVIGVLSAADVEPVAAGVAGEALGVVVERRDGPETLQAVESALEAVPDPTV